MYVYKLIASAHTEDDIEPLIAKAELGDNIERHLLDVHSPLSHLLDRARDEFLKATSDLLGADLTTRDGIQMARSHQATALRYRDMCRWIDDAFEQREAAAEAP